MSSSTITTTTAFNHDKNSLPTILNVKRLAYVHALMQGP